MTPSTAPAIAARLALNAWCPQAVWPSTGLSVARVGHRALPSLVIKVQTCQAFPMTAVTPVTAVTAMTAMTHPSRVQA